ncbi:MAG: GIY-YIG nuclease family protein [Desulfomonilaceae bacterium]
MRLWKVYLFRCSDGTLYRGTTTDVERRLIEHNTGMGARYTRSRLPASLIWFFEELTKSEAFREEYRIKRLSKGMKKAMIDLRTAPNVIANERSYNPKITNKTETNLPQSNDLLLCEEVMSRNI